MKQKSVLIIILIGLIILVSSGCIETGRGSSVDTLYGLEYQGLIWKTYSVWLTNDHPYEGHSAIYSIAEYDTATLEQVQKAINNKQKVKVLYRNELWVWDWDYSSSTIIYDIEELP